MDEKNALLRRLPSVDELIKHADLAEAIAEHGHCVTTAAIRACLQATRLAVLEATVSEINLTALIGDVEERVMESTRYRLRPVINATGVILHTNLGRAPLARRAAEHVAAVIAGYSTLEYDLERGSRGHRADGVADLLRELTGAEAAVVTNNNAAAVLLALTALCRGGDVIVSRGELVEIGGAFRIPEVMEASGAHLKEVGTTNKTRLADYAAAIDDNTAALLKVHTSNYRVVGFTEDVDLAALKTLAASCGIPLIHDLGSGAFVDLSPYGIQGEPTVRQSFEAGADLVCFSGDKLLGGPQCGIIAGSAAQIEIIRKHPLMRALRVDKMTLAALETTLQLYRDDTVAQRDVPILAMLAATPSDLQVRADKLAAALKKAGQPAAVIETTGVLGGGSAPTERVASCAVALPASDRLHPDALAGALRRQGHPVIARIEDDRVCFDLRTVAPADDELLRCAILEALGMHDA